MYCIHMYVYFVLQSLVIRNSQFQSQMHKILQMWNNAEDLYVEEDCYELAGDRKEEYKLECKVGN